MTHLRLVEPSPEVTVHPTIASALHAVHEWMADHPDAAIWLAELPIERQLQLNDMAIRCYLNGRISATSGTPA